MSRFDILAGIPHAVTTRHGGSSTGPYASLNLGYATADVEASVAANRAAVLGDLGLAPERVFGGWLSHGKEVSEFRAGRPDIWPVTRRPVRAGSARSETLFRSDAVVSDVPGLHFMLTFADCVPLLFADRKRGVVAAAHAGWRGSAAGIAPAVIDTMTGSFGSRPQDIVAAIGPSIGPCCYVVGEEVPVAFAAYGYEPTTVRTDRALTLDLWGSNLRQLRAAGLAQEAIAVSGVCTACHSGAYFSHRAGGGVTGRFAAFIGLSS